MITCDFNYVKPRDKDELFAAIEHNKSALLAGGTDLLVALREESHEVASVIDLKAISELQGIYQQDDKVFIGAAETIRSVVEHPLTQEYAALIEGANRIGCYEIRCRATLGGNICNASPSADSIPGLLLYNAEVVLISKKGVRIENLADFLLGPGKVDLQPGELLQGVVLPKVPEGSSSCFFRSSRVKGMDLSGLSVAVYSNNLSDFRIALGAVWPTVSRAHRSEAILNSAPFSEELLEQALKSLHEDIQPRKSSLRASPEYKREMVDRYIRRAVERMSKGGRYDKDCD